MSGELNEMIKKAAAIKAAIAPVERWMEIYKNPAWAALQKNNLYTSSINDMVHQWMKKPAHFDAFKNLQNVTKQRTIKGKFLFSDSWWDSMAAITTNQHNISAVLSKNLAMMPAYAKAQAGIPSLLHTAFDPASPLHYTSKLATLQATLKGISSQIAFKGFGGLDNDLLEKFTTTTNEAVTIAQEITEKEFATKADIARLEIFIGTTLESFKEDIKDQIKKTAKSPFALINLWATIIGIILTIFTIIQTCQSQHQPSGDSVTKEEVQELKQYVDEKFHEALYEAALAVKVRTNCHLRYNPSQKSKGFFQIKVGEIVHIIETRHKWARIAVTDRTDNLPITGWVLKKYLIHS
jgi:hypothetical protein